jgi:hypothetical protein
VKRQEKLSGKNAPFFLNAVFINQITNQLNLFKKFSEFFASMKSQEPKTTFPLQFLFLLE